MGWFYLIFAGLVEIAWSQSIKPTHNFTRPVPTLICLTLMTIAALLLSLSMKTIPVGTAYVVFTGIGAIGAVTLGIIIHKDPMTLWRMAAVALIIGGVVLARVTNTE